MREESAGDGAGPHTINPPADAIAALVHELRNALNTISVASQVIDSKIASIAGLINQLEAANIPGAGERNASDVEATRGRSGDGVT